MAEVPNVASDMVGHASDEQWSKFLDFIAPDQEFCKSVFLRPGFRARIAKKWTQAVIILNDPELIKEGGSSKTLAGWKTAWAGLKYRARRAMRKRPLPSDINPLYVKLVATVGYGTKGEGVDEDGEEREEEDDAPKEVAEEREEEDHSPKEVAEEREEEDDAPKEVAADEHEFSPIIVEFVDTDIESYLRMIESNEEVAVKVEPMDDEGSKGGLAENSKLVKMNIKEEIPEFDVPLGNTDQPIDAHVVIDSDDDLDIVYEDIVTVHPNVENIKKENLGDAAVSTCVAFKGNRSQVKIESNDDVEVLYQDIKNEEDENNDPVLKSLENTPVRVKIMRTPPSIGHCAIPNKRLTYDGGNISSMSSVSSDTREQIAALDQNTAVMRELINVLKRLGS